MHRVLKLLLDNQLLQEGSELYFNTDELIMEFPASSVRNTALTMQKLIQTSEHLADIRDILKLEIFKIVKLSNYYPYFLKYIMDVETGYYVSTIFRGVPPEHFAICFKHFYGTEVEERDTKIAWNTKHNRFDTLEPHKLQLRPLEDIRPDKDIL